MQTHVAGQTWWGLACGGKGAEGRICPGAGRVPIIRATYFENGTTGGTRCRKATDPLREKDRRAAEWEGARGGWPAGEVCRHGPKETLARSQSQSASSHSAHCSVLAFRPSGRVVRGGGHERVRRRPLHRHKAAAATTGLDRVGDRGGRWPAQTLGPGGSRGSFPTVVSADLQVRHGRAISPTRGGCRRSPGAAGRRAQRSRWAAQANSRQLSPTLSSAAGYRLCGNHPTRWATRMATWRW